jgi:hypothetical protein
MAVDYDRLNRSVRDKFGAGVTYTPTGGDARAVTAIIERNYYADTGGVGIQTDKFLLQVVAADVPELAAGDAFSFLGVDYVAVEIRPDFFGMIEVFIQES